MKILRVIVDRLPLSASCCDASWDRWDMVDEKEHVGCKYRLGWWLMTEQEFTTTRCPSCPLALEHDNAKVTNEEE